MSTKEKLIERFNRQPSDFTFDELITLMGYLGFKTDNLGVTSGSRLGFKRENVIIRVHKPHPGKIVGKKTLKYIKQTITELGLWED